MYPKRLPDLLREIGTTSGEIRNSARALTELAAVGTVALVIVAAVSLTALALALAALNGARVVR